MLKNRLEIQRGPDAEAHAQPDSSPASTGTACLADKLPLLPLSVLHLQEALTTLKKALIPSLITYGSIMP